MPHEASREFPYPRSKVYDALPSALSTIKGMSIKWVDPNSFTVQASTRVSFASWGENIFIQVLESDPDRSTVTVEVRLKAQLFGWGRQQKDINNIFDVLGRVLAGTAAA